MKTAVKHLKPHPLNAEIYQLSGIEDLAESIEQVGLLEPLVVNEKNQVISGHRRLRAIKQLKWKSVEVIVRKDIPQDNEAVKSQRCCQMELATAPSVVQAAQVSIRLRG